MTLFEFRNDFTRIGGGSRRWAGERTRKGRLRVSAARASASSPSPATVTGSRWSPGPTAHSSSRSNSLRHPRRLMWCRTSESPCLPGCSSNASPCVLRRTGKRGGRLEEGIDYQWSRRGTRLSVSRDVGPVILKVRFDCKNLAFRAYLDFDKLLQLADNADLEKLDDFASIEVFEREPLGQGTIITAEQLKNFVRRELRVDRRKGFVRNISSRSGLEHFLWSLSRCTPIPYASPAENPNPSVAKLLTLPTQATLSHLEVVHGKSSTALNRPIYPMEPGGPVVPADMLVEVDIDEGGLKAAGFLARLREHHLPRGVPGTLDPGAWRFHWRSRVSGGRIVADRGVEGRPEPSHRGDCRALWSRRGGHAEPRTREFLRGERALQNPAASAPGGWSSALAAILVG